MKYKLRVRTICEIGQRDNQEDCIFPIDGKATDDDRLFVLCDGMGGHEAGEVASQTVCEAMSKYILENCNEDGREFTIEDMRAAVDSAFDALDTKINDDVPQSQKMGTTMTCLRLHDKGYMIAHIGDSRVYHIRPGKTGEDTQIIHVTRDHSLINDLIAIGELTEEEAKQSKQKNVITRAMQPRMERRPQPEIYESADIEDGDYFYLCSDGMLENEEWDNTYIRNNFSQLANDEDQLKNRLIQITDGENGSKDNHSAIIVHILEVVREQEDQEEANIEDKKFLDAKEQAEKAGEAEVDSTGVSNPPKQSLSSLLRQALRQLFGLHKTE